MNSWSAWLHGLVAAAIGAGAGAVPCIIVDPATFNFSHAGFIKIGQACTVSALLAAALYLKQSPLPSSVTTVTATLTKTITETPTKENS